MAKLLLTGSTGFFGRNFLIRALKNGLNGVKYSEVVLPLRNAAKLEAQLFADGLGEFKSKIRVIETSAPTWDLRGHNEFDHVVHAAGVLFERSLEDYRHTNVMGSLNLLSQLRGSPRVLILSSQAAYGPSRDAINGVKESDTPKPSNDYGRSKLEMENEIQSRFPEMSVLNLRPPMILGPRDPSTLALYKMARGPIVIKPGSRTKTYSFIHIEDLIDAVMLGLDSKIRGGYFIAHPTPIQDMDLMKGLKSVVGGRGKIVAIPEGVVKAVSFVVDSVPWLRKKQPVLTRDRVKDLFEDNWVISPAKFISDFAWTPKKALGATLQDSYDWYKANGKI